MQKKLIALAVAAAAAAPAFAQSNVTIYGQMRVSVDHRNNNTAANSDSWQVRDNASRIGFKGSEDLGGGMKAIWQWETNLNTTQPGDLTGGYTGNQTATSIGQRNTFLGLSGGFGTVLAGTHDTPYKLGGSADLFGDTAADAQCGTAGTNVACIIGRNGFDNRANNAIAYISPTWSGFHFAVAGVAGEQASLVAGNAARADGLFDALSMVAVYENGPLKVTLANEKFKKELGSTAATNGYVNNAGTAQAGTAASTAANDKSATKLNVGYKVGAIGLGYTYERSNDGYSATQLKDKAHLASVSYAMGATTLGLQYGKFNDATAGSAEDTKTLTLGAFHALSKRTQAYAAYHDGKQSNTTTSNQKILSLGLNHSF